MADAMLVVMLSITAVTLGFVLYVDTIRDPIATFLAWLSLGLCTSIAVSLLVRTMS